MSSSEFGGGTPRLIEVGERVWAYVQPDGTWWVNNSGAIIGDEGMVCVDTCATEARTRAFQNALGVASPVPVRVVVNTHHHGDHTFGNWLFDDALIVSAPGVREGIAAWGAPRSSPWWTEVEWGRWEQRLPDITITETSTVWLDGARCDVIPLGTPAHTWNDCVVWMPQSRVLFAGDLVFNGGTPFVAQGSVSGSIEVIEQILMPLDPLVVVPGHGPITDSTAFDVTLSYLRFVQRIAADAETSEVTALEAARGTDLGSFAHLTDPERLVGNLYRAIAEHRGLPRGSALDTRRILTDMVAYNGGPLLTKA